MTVRRSFLQWEKFEEKTMRTFTVKEIDGARITKLQIYKEPVIENEPTEEA